MKVLVTGADGLLGRALRTAPGDRTVVACSRTEFDLTEPGMMEAIVAAERPDVLVNAAAYTDVDRAEVETARAEAVNSTGVADLARVCRRHDVRLIHVSTDYVFDGRSRRPYKPGDTPAPLSVYGATKLAGERNVRETAGLRWHILRTAWLYGPAGRNFVGTMLRCFREQTEVRVVDDQFGSPTSSASLARCIWRLVATPEAPGILHYNDSGLASRYEFAVAILETARSLGIVGTEASVVPVRTGDYPTAAERPAFSALDTSETTESLGLTPPRWDCQLRRVLRETVQ